jgi:hypothetical protein
LLPTVRFKTPAFGALLGAEPTAAQVKLFLDLHNYGVFVSQILAGRWLFPIGVLILRSGFETCPLEVARVATRGRRKPTGCHESDSGIRTNGGSVSPVSPWKTLRWPYLPFVKAGGAMSPVACRRRSALRPAAEPQRSTTRSEES